MCIFSSLNYKVGMFVIMDVDHEVVRCLAAPNFDSQLSFVCGWHPQPSSDSLQTYLLATLDQSDRTVGGLLRETTDFIRISSEE